MGKVRVIYDETTRQMKRLGWYGKLTIEGTRKAASGALRYCLHENNLYLPEDESIIANHRMCWGLISSVEIEECPWLVEFDKTVPENPLDLLGPGSDLGFGLKYSKRHQETPNGRSSVSEFIADMTIREIDKDPDVLLTLSKVDFERLIAELFARHGFEVDLFRKSKDDGIDFLAVSNDDLRGPAIFTVQTKHPDASNSKGKRTTLPVATVREIYGVAKAWDLHGGIVVTSGEYSRAAKKFAELKPAEMAIYNARSILDWVRRYRWGEDEK